MFIRTSVHLEAVEPQKVGMLVKTSSEEAAGGKSKAAASYFARQTKKKLNSL